MKVKQEYFLFAAFAIVLISFILGIWLYQSRSISIPDTFASHWDAAGEVNGYMPKFWGLFLMPIISLIMLGLFVVLPKIDPLKKYIATFKTHYNTFILAIIAFLFYIHTLTIAWNLGIRYNMIAFLSPAFAVLFYYCGILIENSKRNWFIGIRTPWTMSSDKVWESTHKIGGKLFKAVGIISLIGLFFQEIAIFFVIVPILLVSIYLFVYSYLEFKKENKGKIKKKK